MNTKYVPQIIVKVSSMISVGMLFMYVYYIISLNISGLTRPSAFEQISLFFTYFMSVVYFVCTAIFECASEKFVNTLLLIQCITALCCSFSQFRVSYLDFEFAYMWYEMFLYCAFYALLYVSENYKLKEFLAFCFGFGYIAYSIIQALENQYISFPTIASCVAIFLYTVYYFTFDNLSIYIPKNEILYITDDPEYDLLEEKNRIYFNTKRAKNVLIAGLILLFISTFTYLLLLNFGLIYGIINNKIVELLCYGSLSILTAMLSRVFVKISNNSKSVRILLPYLLALVTTIAIICLNSFYHFIDFNTMFRWEGITSFPVFVKADIVYSIKGGWLRYTAVLSFNIILHYLMSHIKENNEPQYAERPQCDIIEFHEII